MTKTIWKYQLDLTEEQIVEMPGDAYPISIGEQNGRLVLWAMVQPEEEYKQKTIRIVGTGQPIPEDKAYRNFIGTVQIDLFVWHVFEEEIT